MEGCCNNCAMINVHKGNNYFAVDNRKYGTMSSRGMKNARALTQARAFFIIVGY